MFPVEFLPTKVNPQSASMEKALYWHNQHVVIFIVDSFYIYLNSWNFINTEKYLILYYTHEAAKRAFTLYDDKFEFGLVWFGSQL